MEDNLFSLFYLLNKISKIYLNYIAKLIFLFLLL